MDAQKVAEAASQIKKAELAERWFSRVSNSHDRVKISIDTNGSITGFEGHGEAKGFLNDAMNVHREDIITTAMQLAQKIKVQARDIIKLEASHIESDNGL